MHAVTWAALASIGLVGLCGRSLVAATTLSTLHADEWYQALELAHVIVYKHGLVAIELRSSIAMRSPLLGLVLALVIWAIDTTAGQLGSYHDIVLPATKAVFGAWTALVPIAGFRLCSSLGSGDCVALMVAALLATHEFFVYHGAHTISNSAVSPLVLLAGCLLLPRAAQTNRAGLTMAGWCWAIAVYIRPDVLVITLIVAVSASCSQGRPPSIRSSGWVAMGGSLGGGLGLAVDYWWYQRLVCTPFNWAYKNMVDGVADMHGVEPDGFWYWRHFAEPGVVALLAISLVAGWAHLVHSARTCQSSCRLPLLLQLAAPAAIGSLLVFSMVGHKEIRFVHDAAIGLVIMVAVGTATAAKQAAEVLGMLSRHIASRRQIVEVTIAMLGVGVIILESWWRRDPANWSAFDGMNSAMARVGAHPNATGLIVAGFWWDTASWFAVHKPIPIVSAVDNESLMILPDPNAMLGRKCGPDFPEEFSPTYWAWAEVGALSRHLKDERFNFLLAPASAKNSNLPQALASFGFREVDIQKGVYTFKKA